MLRPETSTSTSMRYCHLHYRVVFVGSWKIPTPIYNAEGNDPYNIMPYLQRFIQRRFKNERDVHSNIISDVHLRIKTIVNREFVECVVTKPLTFFEHRTGRDPGSWFGGMYPRDWAIPTLADPRGQSTNMTGCIRQLNFGVQTVSQASACERNCSDSGSDWSDYVRCVIAR